MVTKARAVAIAEMEAKAPDMGANMIVGFGVDYEKFGAENSPLEQLSLWKSRD